MRHDAEGGPANYIRQILPHGFESFSLVFGRHLTGIDLAKMAAEMKAVLGAERRGDVEHQHLWQSAGG